MIVFLLTLIQPSWDSGDRTHQGKFAQGQARAFWSLSSVNETIELAATSLGKLFWPQQLLLKPSL